MTSEKYKEDDFADIFELCEVINIQATGPKEASKALKHALKYGNIHSQIRAITILKSLTENCGDKFVGSLRNMAISPYTDPRVHKRLLLLFAEWSTEFKNKPGYETLANLHNGTTHRTSISNVGLAAKKDKEKSKSGTSGVRSKKGQQSETRPVTYSPEKINETIGLATQNATNLVNALTLLSPGSDLTKDTELQELVHKCKSSSEILMKMIPTAVTDKSRIGPLLQSNDQVTDALALYSEFNSSDNEVNNVTSGIKNIKLQKQKEIDDDISGLGLNKKKNQAEEAAKIHKDFGDLIDFDAFSSKTNSNTSDNYDSNSTYTDPFADPFADPVTTEPTEPVVNKPKRRLEW
ncbi:15822_t:CDS:10 [Rhizophagus irregularis]|nr:15822_t:CDS:10 [Rhizophagus irregularis]